MLPDAWSSFVYLSNYVYAREASWISWGWSLCIEEHFYLALPVLAPLLVRWVPARALGGVLVGLTVLPALLRWAWWRAHPGGVVLDGPYYYTHTHAEGLLLGVAIAYLHLRHRDALAAVVRRLGPLCWLAGLAGFGAVVVWGGLARTGGFPVVGQFAVAAWASGLLLVNGLARRDRFTAILAHPVWYPVARVSYGMYLIHPFVLAALMSFWPGGARRGGRRTAGPDRVHRGGGRAQLRDGGPALPGARAPAAPARARASPATERPAACGLGAGSLRCRAVPRSLPLLLVVGLLCAPPAEAAGDPVRLDDWLPERVSLRLEHRIRYERLNDPFRLGSTEDQDILALRTLVHARLQVAPWLVVGAEGIDARAYLEDGPVSTGIVNSFDLQQGYAELTRSGPWDGDWSLRGGRLTMDVGSRRLVARNRFRNTINAFTGLDLRWTRGDREARAFWVLPVQRRPFRPDDTEDNDVEFDEETFDVQFWGLFYGTGLPRGHRAELALFGLHEEDSDDRPTRDRELYTPTLRIWKPPQPGQLDYAWEMALQFGESRASVASLRDLDHFAHFHHVEVGWSFEAPASPRLIAQLDYASGDEDPFDGDNNRFDTLFGARRFDFGPHGHLRALRPGQPGHARAAPAREAVGARDELRGRSRLLAGGKAGCLGGDGTAGHLRRLGPLPRSPDRDAGAVEAVAGEPPRGGRLRPSPRRELPGRRPPVQRTGRRDLLLHPADDLAMSGSAPTR